MGPSGSGKTTLLNLIGGLDTPTAGSIMVDGRRIDQLSSGELARWRAAHVGFVFQLYNLLPVLSAQRNVELPLLLTNLSAAQRRQHAEIALTLVGLQDRARHKPKELSGGQEQRVAIARAIVSDPTLLVCDEPTGDLDRAADEILTLQMSTASTRRRSIVTHDPWNMPAASSILTRALWRTGGTSYEIPATPLGRIVPQEDSHHPDAPVGVRHFSALQPPARRDGGLRVGRR
jgi:putative ABC transport system ATP-binding protein